MRRLFILGVGALLVVGVVVSPARGLISDVFVVEEPDREQVTQLLGDAEETTAGRTLPSGEPELVTPQPPVPDHVPETGEAGEEAARRSMEERQRYWALSREQVKHAVTIFRADESLKRLIGPRDVTIVRVYPWMHLGATEPVGAVVEIVLDPPIVDRTVTLPSLRYNDERTAYTPTEFTWRLHRVRRMMVLSDFEREKVATVRFTDPDSYGQGPGNRVYPDRPER